MSDSETQIWEDEDTNSIIQEDAVSDALSFLDDPEETPYDLEDEEVQAALEVEQGMDDDYIPAMDQDNSLNEEFPVEEASDNFEIQSDLSLEEEVMNTETEMIEEEVLEAESFEAYPSYEEEVAVEEEAAATSVEVSEPAPAVQEGADDFNLATLNQLVDEIRQESERVAEMKSSVAKALSLIQEMTESLKS